MTDDYTMLTWAMWIFMAFFLVAGISSITWDNKYGNKKTTTKFAAALSLIIFLITIARLIVAIQINKMDGSHIILILVWLIATVMQFLLIRDRR